MDDIAKLRVLLPHWLEHNAEHADEFRAWARRARAAGDDHLAEQIDAAAEKMEATKDNLEAAIARLAELPSDAPSQELSHHQHSHPH